MSVFVVGAMKIRQHRYARYYKRCGLLLLMCVCVTDTLCRPIRVKLVTIVSRAKRLNRLRCRLVAESSEPSNAREGTPRTVQYARRS